VLTPAGNPGRQIDLRCLPSLRYEMPSYCAALVERQRRRESGHGGAIWKEELGAASDPRGERLTRIGFCTRPSDGTVAVCAPIRRYPEPAMLDIKWIRGTLKL